MCKYEMDPASIVEDTERARFCPQTDRQTDGQTDKVKPVYPPFSLVEVGGMIIYLFSLPRLALLFNAPSGWMYTNNWIVLWEYETHADGKIWNPEP